MSELNNPLVLELASTRRERIAIARHPRQTERRVWQARVVVFGARRDRRRP